MTKRLEEEPKSGSEQEEVVEGKKEQQEKVSYSKFIVFLMFVTIIAFTVTCLVFYWNGKTVDPTLILSFFSCFGFEFGSLAYIKCKDLKYMGGDPTSKKMPHIVRIIDENKEEKDD